MPVCYITFSNSIKEKKDEIISQLRKIRNIVADGLDSRSRLLDETHIALRIQESLRDNMLADIELDIHAQFYLRRYFSRDKRAYQISKRISESFDCSCATWINLSNVGYARVCDGQIYFSTKLDDRKLRKKRKKERTLKNQ